MKNAIAWFEIPTTQLDRAQAFYEAVLGQTLRRENMGPSEGAVFPYDGAGAGPARLHKKSGRGRVGWWEFQTR